MMARSDDHCRHDYAPVAIGYQKSEGAKDVKVHFGQSMRLLNEESRVDHQRGARSHNGRRGFQSGFLPAR